MILYFIYGSSFDKLFSLFKKTLFLAVVYILSLIKICVKSTFWVVGILGSIAVFLWVTLSWFSSIPLYKWEVFWPDTPKKIGVMANTYQSEDNSIFIETDYIPGKIIFPYSSLNDGELTKMFFSPYDADEKINEMRVSEKYRLLMELFPFNSEDSMESYQEIFSFIPNKLLHLMKNDGLEIILSELPPAIDDSGITTGYYERSKNRIIVYRSKYQTTTLVHELGHWIESYIKRNLDFYVLNRITDIMLNEIDTLGLNEFNTNYAKSDNFEVFATLFEFFIHDYEKLKTNAPVSHEYMTYYLEKLLID